MRFFMSRVSIPIFCFGLILSFRVLRASMVGRPFLNPNCLSWRPLVESKKSLKRLSIIFLRSFPRQSRRHRGLYEAGSPRGLSPFLIRTSLAVFHVSGKVPSSRVRLGQVKMHTLFEYFFQKY